MLDQHSRRQPHQPPRLLPVDDLEGIHRRARPRALGRLRSSQAPSHALLAVVVRMTLAPLPARATVSLLLT
jgi:hypothetical protein